MDKKRMAKIFKMVRTSLDLCQKDVAAKIKVTQQSYACFESGTLEPTITSIERLCKVFKISIVRFWVLFYDNSRNLTYTRIEQLFQN